MLARINSATVYGIEGMLVQVEVDLSRGLPSFNIVGLPDPAVRESRERVRAAIKNSGFDFPIKRITINLAPADIRKIGPHYDLAIAVGILAAEGYVNTEKLRGFLLAGELSLTGEVREVKGILPMVLKAREKGIKGAVIPAVNYREAVLVDGIESTPVKTLSGAVSFLNYEQSRQSGSGQIEGSGKGLKEKDSKDSKDCARNKTGDTAKKISDSNQHKVSNRDNDSSDRDRDRDKDRDKDYDNEISVTEEEKGERVDLSDVKGQQEAKRALEIAAAGRHNLLMIGPPGTGKTMLARRLRTILPPLTREESLELSRIYSVLGLADARRGLITERPFRAPHHSITAAGLIGGGKIPEPGEISMAHLGTLFLDELPEYRREILEMLRQPLEEREVTLVRSAMTVTYPSNFLLITAMNPCPCGYYGDMHHECQCTVPQINRYRNKVSGPLLDRIDIHVEVPGLSVDEITGKGERGESSAVIRKRVLLAHRLQLARYQDELFNYNSELRGKLLKNYCRLDREGLNLLKGAINSLGLSARAYDRILRLARTIADLEWAAENIDDQSQFSAELTSGSFTGVMKKELSSLPEINSEHIAEAIQYRSFDRKI